MKSIMVRFIREDQGAAGVEYGLLVALIAAVIIGTVKVIGTTLETNFQTVCTALGGTGC